MIDDTNSPDRDTPEDRAYRVGFKRTKREDFAVDKLREARASLDDPARVNRILFEVGRYWNAIADRPLVPLATRQQIVRLLEQGDPAEAARIIDACLAAYQVSED